MTVGKIQIVGKTSSGMAKDMALLGRELRAAAIPSVQTERHDLTLRQRVTRKIGLHHYKPRRYRMNIFVQQPEEWWMPEARVNVVIPNQEWFTSYGVRLLPKIDEVWCKTHHAETIFSKLGCRTRFMGFSSHDKWVGEFARAKRYDQFLHVGGGSIWKGTQLLIDTWCRHPEWPQLTVVSRTACLPVDTSPRNVTLLNAYVPEQEMIELQNRVGFHIQPTEMEGFGHSLVEAMSVHSIVIATDAPPMNEIVRPERGILIPAGDRMEQHYLGLRHFVMPQGIETAVERALSLSGVDLRVMAERGRDWFEQHNATFRTRFRELVHAHV